MIVSDAKRFSSQEWQEEHESVRLRCFYRGNPKPEVKWFKKGPKGQKKNFIQPQANRYVIFRHTLLIHNLSLGDAGQYRCVVSNTHGKAYHDVLLEVDSKYFADFDVIWCMTLPSLFVELDDYDDDDIVRCDTELQKLVHEGSDIIFDCINDCSEFVRSNDFTRVWTEKLVDPDWLTISNITKKHLPSGWVSMRAFLTTIAHCSIAAGKYQRSVHRALS